MVANLETIGPDVLSQPLNNNFASLNSAKMEKVADSDLNMNGRSITNIARHNIQTSGNVLTISNGAITVTQSYHVIDTEGSSPEDDLDTINGGNVGDLLILRQNNANRDITIRNQGGGTGNIRTFDWTDIKMEGNASTVMLLRAGDNWFVVGTNGVKRSGDTMTGRLQINNQLYYGTGSPEGVVTAPPGSIYQNTSGGTGTTLYVKRSGTGNTGWFAVA